MYNIRFKQLMKDKDTFVLSGKWFHSTGSVIDCCDTVAVQCSDQGYLGLILIITITWDVFEVIQVMVR